MSRVTVVKDSVSKVVWALTDIVCKQVLIGIPDSSTERDDEDVPMTNATLAYIHEYGSPAANIPARPFLIPGVEKAKEPALVELRAAADATLKFDSAKADKHLNLAGQIGMVSAKDAIENGNFVPLKPATVRARKYKRGTKSRRPAEEKYLELVKGGMPPGDAQVAAGIKPLIDTGQLRNSLTYVVRRRRK